MQEYIALAISSVIGSGVGIGTAKAYRYFYLATARSVAKKAVKQYIASMNVERAA